MLEEEKNYVLTSVLLRTREIALRHTGVFTLSRKGVHEFGESRIIMLEQVAQIVALAHTTEHAVLRIICYCLTRDLRDRHFQGVLEFTVIQSPMGISSEDCKPEYVS